MSLLAGFKHDEAGGARLVEVRCGAPRCRHLLAAVYAVPGGRLDGDDFQALAHARPWDGTPRWALVPASLTGDLEVAVCARHYRRRDGETLHSGRWIDPPQWPPGTETMMRTSTVTLACVLLAEPLSAARATGRTQVLRVA